MGAEKRGGVDQALSDAFVTLVRNGWGQSGSAFIRSFATLFMPDATEDQLQAFVAMQLASASAEAAIENRRAIGVLDATPYAASVKAPTLVIHARDDAVQPFSQGQALARAIPQAEFLALDSRNHVSLPQDPAWQRALIRIERFLSA